MKTTLCRCPLCGHEYRALLLDEFPRNDAPFSFSREQEEAFHQVMARIHERDSMDGYLKGWLALWDVDLNVVENPFTMLPECSLRFKKAAWEEEKYISPFEAIRVFADKHKLPLWEKFEEHEKLFNSLHRGKDSSPPAGNPSGETP